VHTLGLRKRCRQREPRTHRIAHQVGFRDAGMIHQSKDIADKILARIGFGIVRLVAFAMAATVEGEATQAAAFDRAIPADPTPVLVPVRREAMHEHDRGHLAGPEIVKGERDAVRGELRHCQRPVNFGVRFSKNARTPSRWSSVWNSL